MDVFGIVAFLIYLVLALIALWGAFCVVMVWMRVAEKRFRDEQSQLEFLEALDEPLARGDYDAVSEAVADDPRAISQLVQLAVVNRAIGYSKVKALVVDRFQRDVLADLDYRLNWVHTVIKSAPMVGLLGTVVGMMGAFGKLAGAEQVNAEQLAENIMMALITTACGLAIAIPLVLCTASINVRIRKMEDLVGAGLTRFFESFKHGLTRKWRQD